MKGLPDNQEIALRFNEEEAMWLRFQQKRLARRLLEADSSLPGNILDRLDWTEAQRETRMTRAIAQTDRFPRESN
jgi:hypothetical protein